MSCRMMNLLWASLLCSLMGAATSAQTVQTSGTCVDGNLWLLSTDGDHAYADYASCQTPLDHEFRIHCRNGSPFPNILVRLGSDVAPNQHVVMSFTVANTDYPIDGVTYWSDFSQTAGFDGNLSFDGPLLRALTQNETFDVGGYRVHLVGAAAAITGMLAHCGRG